MIGSPEVDLSFGHSCHHLQGVPQYKCQEHNRYDIKFIIEFSKNLSVMKVVYKICHTTSYTTFIMSRTLENSIEHFVSLLLYSWRLYSGTP